MSNRLTGTYTIDLGEGKKTFVAEAENERGVKITRSTTIYDSDADSTVSDKMAQTIQDVQNAW
ncbi:MAG: hypothetical protein IJ760_08290 [Bacteroidales bacterium]|nr:hypothetical protein [Bacteroidales bacterium]